MAALRIVFVYPDPYPIGPRLWWCMAVTERGFRLMAGLSREQAMFRAYMADLPAHRN